MAQSQEFCLTFTGDGSMKTLPNNTKRCYPKTSTQPMGNEKLLLLYDEVMYWTCIESISENEAYRDSKFCNMYFN